MLKCSVCCRCFGLEASAKMYDLLPLLWPRSRDRSNGNKWYILALGQPHWGQSNGNKSHTSGHHFDTKATATNRQRPNQMQQTNRTTCPNAERRCPNAETYDVMPLLGCRRIFPMLRCTISCRCFGFDPNSRMYDLLRLLWCRSGAAMLRCTVCFFCLGLEVVL